MSRRRALAVLFLACSCPLLGAGRVGASDGGDKGRHRSHQDQILEAIKRGEVRPLAEVQAAASLALPGEVVGVKFERRKGRLVYEFKIIAAGGRVREVYIDAATLEVVKLK